MIFELATGVYPVDMGMAMSGGAGCQALAGGVGGGGGSPAPTWGSRDQELRNAQWGKVVGVEDHKGGFLNMETAATGAKGRCFL